MHLKRSRKELSFDLHDQPDSTLLTFWWLPSMSVKAVLELLGLAVRMVLGEVENIMIF